VFTPVYAIACHDAASVTRRAAVRFWTAFEPHRDAYTSLGISALAHLSLFVFIGSALYDSGEDDADIPEISVQLESRPGPNDEEFTDAALPQPMPEPVEQVIDDPGSSTQSFDAPAMANHTPLLEHAPDVDEQQVAAALASVPPELGAVLSTTGSAEHEVAMVAEQPTRAAIADVSPPEKVMLTRNVQKLAQKLLDSELTDTELTWEEDGRQYSARVMRQPAPDSTGIEQVVAEIMTNKDGKRMKTRLSLKRLAFSHFTQLVNSWDPNIQLHDDVIDGRFHSNTEISLTARHGVQPRFFGKVTTAASKLTFDSFNQRRNKDVFQAGYETRTERVLLPRDMPDIVNGGEEGDRRVFDDDTRIIFNPDGSYAWRPANGDGELQRDEPGLRPRYLIGQKGAKLYVRGTVSGIFTVYSPNDIEIEDDLVYARDPRQSISSRDFLALIAGRDICVAGPEVTGGGDVTVHGAIFARRRFYIESVERAESGSTLVMYGSLTAGTLSETEPRFATKIDFDKRFEYLRPASFPMTRRYEVENWEQDWEEVQSGEDGGATGLARAQ
jgi:hypothetical protein